MRDGRDVSSFSLSDYVTETNEYNILGQMTRRRAQENYDFWRVQQDRTYTFSSTNNDGRIAQMADAVSGETVVYQYDSLKRLISAETTGPQWGQSFGFDSFGNLLSQTVTKGSAPNMAVAVNGTTNRITTGGYSYDANGNLTAAPNLRWCISTAWTGRCWRLTGMDGTWTTTSNLPGISIQSGMYDRASGPE